MSKGQFGARHLDKQLWKLPIPEFDAGDELHVSVAQAGERAASGASARLAELRVERGEGRRPLTVAIARRELRGWLRGSEVGAVVGRLLGGG